MNLTDLVTPEQLLLNATLAETNTADYSESLDRLMPFMSAIDGMRGIGFTSTCELMGLLSLLDMCIQQSTAKEKTDA